MVRYGLILALICVIASGLLAVVNFQTKDRIAAQALLEEMRSLKEVMPEGDKFDGVKSAEQELIYYKVYDKDAKFLGAAFKATAKGYSSTIGTMVGMLKDGTITAIKVLNQNETPGMGTRITENEFTGLFAAKTVESLGSVQAITGATVSSRAVIKSVKSKAEQVWALIKDEK